MWSFLKILVGFCLGICVGIYVGGSFLYKVDRYPLDRIRDDFGGIDLPVGKRITLMSLAPNNEARAFLIEQRLMFSTIELRVQKKRQSEISVFIAEAKGPSGTERIIWSKDGSRFILVGRNFYGIEQYPEEFRFENGELLYVLYDLEKNQKYCHRPDIPENNCLPIPKDVSQDFQRLNLE